MGISVKKKKQTDKKQADKKEKKVQTTHLSRQRDKRFWRSEWFWALLIALICAVLSMSNLLWETKDGFPQTADAMGHMAKVRYITDCVKEGHLPSWFPGWYNGAAATQYSAPLSYYLMVPILLLTNNITVTYLCFCVIVLFLGGMGIFAFSHAHIGKWCGLVGIAVYIFQPFLTDSLYGAGVIAQGPIFAIMPWLWLLFLACAHKQDRKNFFGVTVLSTLMILSHAMHAFMVCICMMAVLFVLAVFHKIQWKGFVLSGFGIVFSGVLTAFWSLVGATALENKNIPYLQPESIQYYTTDKSWFMPNGGAVYYFALPATAAVLAAAAIALFRIIKKRRTEKEIGFVFPSVLLAVLTLVFSFGQRLPGFAFIPMSSSLVPGRILSLTAVVSAILMSYLLQLAYQGKNRFRKILAIAGALLVVWLFQPFERSYAVVNTKAYEEIEGELDTKNCAFEKARYSWLGGIESSETYNLLQDQYNISDGWNIEGTPHSYAIWNMNIAAALGKTDYLERQYTYWNVGELLIQQGYADVEESMLKNGWTRQTGGTQRAFDLLKKDAASSYYYVDSRNTLLIGTSQNALNVHFPNLIKDNRDSLLDYSAEELERYDCVYLVEQNIRTLRQKESMEEKIEQLLAAGVKVWIEPFVGSSLQLFDVNAARVDKDKNSLAQALVYEDDCPFAGTQKTVCGDYQQRGFLSLYGLDEVYLSMQQKGGAISNPVMGVRRVENGEVLFVGASLSQCMDTVYVKYNGMGAWKESLEEQNQAIDGLYRNMFDYYGVEKGWRPEVFEASVFEDNYKGGTFTYRSEEANRVTVSITYSPRWAALVDGEEIPVHQNDNLIVLNLPKGSHEVTLTYGVTVYGKLGYLISGMGLLFFIFVLLCFDEIVGAKHSAGTDGKKIQAKEPGIKESKVKESKTKEPEQERTEQPEQTVRSMELSAAKEREQDASGTAQVVTESEEASKEPIRISLDEYEF